MSTLAYAPPLSGARPGRRPGLTLLTAVEVRKLADTRSGRWLAGITVTLSLAVVVLVVLFSPDESLRADQMFQLTLLPASLVLPVLGILSVTTEWSQRTALTTFVLVPGRSRVAVAKLLAASGWALVTWAVSVGVAEVAAAVVRGFDLGDGRASIPLGMLCGGAAYQVLVTVLGVAFGMALLSSPLAIVLYFVLPIGWAIAAEAVPRIAASARWVDIADTTTPLTDGTMTTLAWERLGTSVAAWVLLPLAVGLWRITHREVS